jgi:hypothetical protein
LRRVDYRAHREERQRGKTLKKREELEWPDGAVFGSFGRSVYVSRPEGG